MLIFSIIFAIVVITRGILPSKINLAGKIILSIISVLISLKFFISYLITGRMFYEPNIPHSIIWGMTWLFGIIFILFFLLIFKDLCFLITYLINLITKKYSIDVLKKFFNAFSLAATLLAIIISTIGLFSGFATPQVKEQVIR